MSLPSNTDEGVTPGTDEVVDLDEHAEGRDRRGDDDDEAAQDDPEVLAGMMAGFKAVTGNDQIPDTLKDVQTEGKQRFGGGSDKGDEGDDDDDQGNQPGGDAGDGGEGGQQPSNTDDDRPVFGGLTVKQLREKLAKADAVEQTTRSLAGRVGHLQQQMEAAGKPRALTKEDFPSLREEFGDEYAEAVARDLSKVVTGSPMTKDQIDQEVNTRFTALAQQTERKLVRMAHPDAPDYFAGGKQHEAFMGWVQQLPEERRNSLLNTWDSEVIIPALDDFKKSTTKAAKEAAARGSRIARAVQSGNSAAVDAPTASTIDPIEAGWRKVRGSPSGKGQMRSARH